MIRSKIDEVLTAHNSLPLWLNVWMFAPIVFFCTIGLGLLFPLPPGPLCDEGMILFMEGGCDWGVSNIFFFSKLALLLAAHVVLAWAWFRPKIAPSAFVPHMLLLLAVALMFDSDMGCGNYYGHPNGTTGEMIVEGVAFIGLGTVLLSRLRDGRASTLALALVPWNVTHVGAFYLGLTFTNHWTWLHTTWIVGTLFACAVLVGRLRRRAAYASRRAAASFVIAVGFATTLLPVPSYSSAQKLDLPMELRSYTTWPQLLTSPRPVPLELWLRCMPTTSADWERARRTYGPHTERFIRVYGNDAAAAARSGAKPSTFPAGTVLVKEKLLGSPDGTVQAVAFMTKRAATAFKDTGGWEFSYFPESGEPRRTHESCAACHRSAASTDYVFGTYPR